MQKALHRPDFLVDAEKHIWLANYHRKLQLFEKDARRRYSSWNGLHNIPRAAKANPTELAASKVLVLEESLTMLQK